MSNELIAIPNYGVKDLTEMAKAIAISKFAGCETPEQALTLMLIAQAEGRHPGIIARDYHIIKGRPTLKADAMLARFQDAGGCVRWTCYTDECVTGVFSHPKGGEVEITWNMNRHKNTGVVNDNYKKYGRAMLRARCISEGIRTVYPSVICGSYTPEEMEDIPPLDIDYKEVKEEQKKEKNNKVEVSEEQKRIAFNNAIKSHEKRIGSIKPITDVISLYGFNEIEEVTEKYFREIINAVKVLLPVTTEVEVVKDELF